MDIIQLKTLIHVAELGSLSRASDRLHITQPALSRQIRMLEQELGVILFERSGRGMVLTGAGRDVLDHATRVMAELEAIRNAAAGDRQSFRGTVAIGTTPTVAEVVTIPLARQLRERHPQLRLRFSAAYSGHLTDWLQRGELDLIVTYDPEPLRSLNIVPVMMENLLLVGAGRDRLSLERPVALADLAGEALVLPSPRHSLRSIVDSCARQAGIELTVTVEADAFASMIALVRDGFGSTILPLAPIFPQVQDGSLCAAPLVDPAPERKLVLAYPADRPVSPATRHVGTTFAELAADLVGRGIWMGRMIGSEPNPR